MCDESIWKHFNMIWPNETEKRKTKLLVKLMRFELSDYYELKLENVLVTNHKVCFEMLLSEDDWKIS